VIFCSSIAAMGDIAPNSTEDAACNPIDAYGKGKRDAELIMQSYFKRGLKGTIVRPGDIYGVGFAEGYEKVLQMLKDKKFVMPGDGNNHVPLINVDDATDGIITAAEKMDEMPNQTYLLVGPQKTLNYVIGTACELLNVDMPKRSVPIWLAKAFAWAKMKKADMEGVQTDITPHQVYILTQDRLFDVSKAKAKLGFEAKKELKQGIKEVIEWLKI
jgi:nucleoside-diphosphate-sugar epimerase